MVIVKNYSNEGNFSKKALKRYEEILEQFNSEKASGIKQKQLSSKKLSTQ